MMRMILQEFLNGNSSVDKMMGALDYCGIDYLFVRLNQDNTLTVLDVTSRLPVDDSDYRLNEYLENFNVIGYGSKRFDRAICDMGFRPGSFTNGKFEMDVIRDKIGDELLNNYFKIGKLFDLDPIGDHFFVRPSANSKLFSGMVISREDYLEWQDRENVTGSDYHVNDIVVSELKDIYAEYRFFVVDGEVVTGSSYKVGNELVTDVVPSLDVWDYAQRMVDAFEIADAFVIDIAEIGEGLRVVEYNNLNTSGLYGCDPVAIIQALGRLY